MRTAGEIKRSVKNFANSIYNFNFRLSGEVLVAHLQASEGNKKIEQLNSALNKEKELRIEAEEMFTARQKIFDVYSLRYESKFR